MSLTLQMINEQIARLMELRAKAHGNDAEQARINADLSLLYDRKWAEMRSSKN